MSDEEGTMWCRWDQDLDALSKSGVRIKVISSVSVSSAVPLTLAASQIDVQPKLSKVPEYLREKGRHNFNFVFVQSIFLKKCRSACVPCCPCSRLAITWMSSYADPCTPVHFLRSSQWLCQQSWLWKCPRWCCACLLRRSFPFVHHHSAIPACGCHHHCLCLNLSRKFHVGKPSLLGLYQGFLLDFLSGIRLHHSDDFVLGILLRISLQSSHWTSGWLLFSAKRLKKKSSNS